MTRDDIYLMAKEAGFMTLFINEDTWIPYLEKFAKLVAAAEREACAKVCDVLAVHPEYASNVTKLAALAIRERGAP